MSTHVLVVFYSTYGHTHRMAGAVVEGACDVSGTEVRLRRVPELPDARRALAGVEGYRRAQEAQSNIPEVTHDDLRWAHGIAWGTPTRFGNMCAQMKQFIDTTGPNLSGKREWVGWMTVRRVDPRDDGNYDVAGPLVDMEEMDRGMLGLYLSTQPMAA